MNKQLEEELLSLLHGISMYNDKGYIWANHRESVIDDQRKNLKMSLDKLFLKFDTDQISNDALEILNADDLLTDGSGDYHDIIKKLIKNNTFYTLE